jgi:hypothetical protein
VSDVADAIGVAFGVTGDVDLEMDVVDAAHVTAGINGCEFRDAVGVSKLHAAKKNLFVGGAHFRRRPHRRATGAEIGASVWSTGRLTARAVWSARIERGVAGINSHGVTMPYVERGIRQRSAAIHVHDRDTERELDADAAFGNVFAQDFAIDSIGALLLFRYQRAARLGGVEAKSTNGVELQRGGGADGVSDKAAASPGKCGHFVDLYPSRVSSKLIPAGKGKSSRIGREH